MSQSKSIKAARFKGDHGYKWYKVTSREGGAIIAFGTRYELPVGKSPGAWMTVRGRLRHCQNGYHATQIPYYWARGDRGRRLFEVEVSSPAAPFSRTGMGQQGSKKSLFRSMRFLREIKGEEKKRLLSRKLRAGRY